MAETNPGINKLALVLSGRMKEEGKQRRMIDFGHLDGQLTLTTDALHTPYRKGEYLRIWDSERDHDHQQVCPHGAKSTVGWELKPGDTVVVLWVDVVPVIIGVIKEE